MAFKCKACKKLVPAISASKNREAHEHWRSCIALSQQNCLEQIRERCERLNALSGRFNFYIPTHTTRDSVRIVNLAEHDRINLRYKPVDRGKQ